MKPIVSYLQCKVLHYFRKIFLNILIKLFLSKNIAFLTVLTMTSKKTKVVETLKFDYADFGDYDLDIY